MLSVPFLSLVRFRATQASEGKGALNRTLRPEVTSGDLYTGSTSKRPKKQGTGISFSELSPRREEQIPIPANRVFRHFELEWGHLTKHYYRGIMIRSRLLGVLLLLCLIMAPEGSCETGKALRGKKTTIVRSTPTSVPASNVKLFSATFFEETCRYFDRDGWGEYVLSIVSGAVRAGGGGIRSADKCSVCRTLAERFTRGCKRAVGVSPKKIPRALEPRTEFIRYVTEVIHNSRPPSPEEIKTFLSILAIAYQKAPPEGREYFSILDSFIGPPLLTRIIHEPAPP